MVYLYHDFKYCEKNDISNVFSILPLSYNLAVKYILKFGPMSQINLMFSKGEHIEIYFLPSWEAKMQLDIFTWSKFNFQTFDIALHKTLFFAQKLYFTATISIIYMLQNILRYVVPMCGCGIWRIFFNLSHFSLYEVNDS